MWVGDGVVAGAEVWQEEEDGGGESELHQHMEAGCEEGEVEVEVFGVEHPFVILRLPAIISIEVWSWDWRLGSRLTIDIDNENTYQRPIRRPLINRFRTTF